MKSKSGWKNNYGNGTNSSSFSGLPGGSRLNYVSFYDIGNVGYWWSSNEFNTSNAWLRALNDTNGYVRSYNYPKVLGLSVRCLRD
jgi:uncharacterized protein (TIGR02145 family)